MPYHYRSLDSIHLESAAVTIGSFDGVHLGHRLIISRLVQHARELGAPAVVVTFFPHPMVVLRDIRSPFYLTLPERRAALLHELGVKYVVTIEFTRALSGFTPEAFMRWLQQHLNLVQLCVGEDFALGKGRAGDPPALAELGLTMGYSTEVIPPLMDEGEKVSSSRIRKLVVDGSIDKANSLLGSRFTVVGNAGAVTYRETDGSVLAALPILVHPMQILPAGGLYAARVHRDGANVAAVVEPKAAEGTATAQLVHNAELHMPAEAAAAIREAQPLEVTFFSRLDEARRQPVDALDKSTRIWQYLQSSPEVSTDGQPPKNLPA